MKSTLTLLLLLTSLFSFSQITIPNGFSEVTKSPSNGKKMEKIFMLFDNDGSGKITIDELKKIMTGNAIVNNKVWDEILLDIDQNSDGEISYKEFKTIMRKMINNN